MNYSYILPRRRWYTQQHTIRRAAATLILAGGVLLGGSVLGGRDTARAVENEEPSIQGYLIIPAKLREEKPVHDKRTAVKAPERVEIVEEESPSQPPAAAALHSGREGSPLGDAPASDPSGASQEAPEEVRTYLGSYKITGYDICPSCCGNTKGITASGTTATVGRTCAAPKDIPFGTRLWIEGIGERIVEDRGGAVHGKKLDILCTDHPACYAITGTYEVYIIEEAE
jgi:3D (Asp-Asp-Asp) domain-containing protein